MSQEQLSNDTYSSYARLLGKENFAVEFSRQSTTAYFDVKNRKLVFPVWNVPHDVMVLLSSHEVGHAIYTHWNLLEKFYADYTKKEVEILSGVFNIVEDARIEKLMKRRYPGIGESHRRGYHYLFKSDFFGKVADLADQVNDYHFLDRANLYFKVQTNRAASVVRIKFTPEEAGYIEAMKDAESFQDALDLTAKIYEDLLTKPQDMSDSQIQSTDESNDPEADDSDSEQQESQSKNSLGDDAESDETNGSKSNESSDSEATQKSSKGGAKDEEGEDDESNDFTDDEEDDSVAPEYDDSLSDYDIDEKAGDNEKDWNTQDKLEENLQEKTEGSGQEKIPEGKKFVNIPKKQAFVERAEIYGMVNPSKLNIRYEGKMKRMIQSVRKSATHMANEFSIRKSAHNRKMTHKTRTGQVDSKRLSQYKFADEIFKNRKTKPKQTNHGMLIVVDCSISMRGHLMDMAEQIALCVEFAKKTNVKVEVWGFTSSNERKFNSKLYKITSSETRSLEKDLSRFTCNIKEYEHMVRLKRTPLAMSMFPMAELAEDFKTRHKVEKFSTIVLTDGGDNSRMKLPGVDSDFYRGKIYDEKTKTLINCELGQVEGAFRFYKNRVGGRLVHIFLGSNSAKGYDPFSVPAREDKREGWIQTFVPALQDRPTVVDKMFAVDSKKNKRPEDITNPEGVDPKEVTKMLSKQAKAPKIFLDELVDMIS